MYQAVHTNPSGVPMTPTGDTQSLMLSSSGRSNNRLANKKMNNGKKTSSGTRNTDKDLASKKADNFVAQQHNIPSGTRVFKKSSPNDKITVYLGKRDFVDHITHTDPIDGVILVDPEFVKGEYKVWGSLLAAFRYGREDLDVLGLTFRKDLYLAVAQIYPPIKTFDPKNLTKLQERLLKKLGPNAYPFVFEIPSLAPASVILQPAPNDTGKPCGVDYELKCFVAPSLEEKPVKRSTIRLAIRKVMYAPDTPYYTNHQPHTEITKEFLMSPGPILLEVSLDKKKYYHGETIAVNVQVSNNSNKTIKKIRISVKQYADICLFSTAQYKCSVAEIESDDGFPLFPCCNLSKVYYLTPLLSNNRDKRGLALDGKLKHEDTNLASSTIFKDERFHFKGTNVISSSSSPYGKNSGSSSYTPLKNGCSSNKGNAEPYYEDDFDEDGNGTTGCMGGTTSGTGIFSRTKERENLGIIVRYTVKVRLLVAFGQDVCAEVGFILTHPKPVEEPLGEDSFVETGTELEPEEESIPQHESKNKPRKDKTMGSQQDLIDIAEDEKQAINIMEQRRRDNIKKGTSSASKPNPTITSVRKSPQMPATQNRSSHATNMSIQIPPTPRNIPTKQQINMTEPNLLLDEEHSNADNNTEFDNILHGEHADHEDDDIVFEDFARLRIQNENNLANDEFLGPPKTQKSASFVDILPTSNNTQHDEQSSNKRIVSNDAVRKNTPVIVQKPVSTQAATKKIPSSHLNIIETRRQGTRNSPQPQYYGDDSD